MSVNTLMKNVYTFVDILCQAGGEAIQHWNEKSVHNAFNWARYCQQVYQETVGRPFRDELDKHIQALPLYLSHPSCLEISLDSLHHAETLVIETLVNNPLLSTKLLEHIVDHCIGTTGQLESLVNVCAENSKSIQIVNTYERILDCLGISCEQFKLESQAEILLKVLASHHRHSNNEERYQTFVHSVLQYLSRVSGGWDIIAHFVQNKKDISREITHTDTRKEFSTKPSIADAQESVLWWITENKLC